jgi:protease-4
MVVLPGCISVSLLPAPGPLEETVLTGEGNAKILVIDVSGVLSSSSSGWTDKSSLPARVKEELIKAAEDKAIKALVLRINTPGGTVTASDILHHEITLFKEKRNIPVVSSILDLGTSGGYYVAVAGDKILAQPSSVTGSMGVIMLTLNASGLLEKVGIEAQAVTSGPRKDMGSPFRAMTPEEHLIFQDVIDSFYGQFLNVIYQGRPQLSKDRIRTLADGRIYTAPQALKHGLIDRIGYLDDAIELAKQEAGLDTARVVMYHRPGGYHPTIYSKLSKNTVNLESLAQFHPDSFTTLLGGGTPKFMYLWLP